MKLDALKFALAGGILCAVGFAIATVLALLGVPGFPSVVAMLVSFYGPYGYTASWFGFITGAIWGFIEGFIDFGIFAWIYNKLAKQ